ncbi:3'-5' exonuclease [marine bacterium AO1-C]|nr:3'-5' exonuclease [marine bacterium AO1-C]
MVYIIVDLEATCWEKRENRPNEIIEIGAVAINDEGEWIDEFDIFVKPLLHPVLSDFCIQLTSITQEMVDKASNFPQALQEFQNWITNCGSTEEDYVLCSWGHYDRVQFKNDCVLHGLDAAWLASHISLKHQYADLKNLRRPIGMKKALQREGLKLDGTHHRGLDDAQNIAKIFLNYFEFWTMP